MIKEEILEKVRQDNDMTLDLAKELKMPQATVFARIDRKSKTFKALLKFIPVLFTNCQAVLKICDFIVCKY